MSIRKEYILINQYHTTAKILIDVSHVSKRGSSLRITVPKRVIEKMKIKPEDIVGFFEEDGKIYIERIE